MSDSTTPLAAASRTRATRRSAGARKPRTIRRAPRTPVAALLEAARDRRLAEEAERVERFTRDFKELQRAVHELLTVAAQTRLDAEAARLERSIADERARAEFLRVLIAGSRERRIAA